MNCLDTYALMEFIHNNPQYTDVLNKEFVMADATLAEFYSILRRNHNVATAEHWLKLLTTFARKIDLSIWIKAVTFRQEHAKERLSLYDCLGYCFAQENGYTFVTGDKAFKNKKGVKYIK